MPTLFMVRTMQNMEVFLRVELMMIMQVLPVLCLLYLRQLNKCRISSREAHGRVRDHFQRRNLLF